MIDKRDLSLIIQNQSGICLMKLWVLLFLRLSLIAIKILGRPFTVGWQRGAQSSKDITFENIRLCVHIFSDVCPRWRAVLLLHDTKFQIKSCALFLNIDISSTIAANWDLTLHSSHSHVHYDSCFKSFRLEPFDLPKRRFLTMSFFRLDSKSLLWSKTVVDSDAFNATCVLQKAYGDSSSLIFLVDRNCIRASIMDPSLSPWKFRFKSSRDKSDGRPTFYLISTSHRKEGTSVLCF